MKKFSDTKAHLFFCIFLAWGICLSSCSDNEDAPEIPETPEETVFMFFPYSGNLYDEFNKNISAFETSIVQNNGLKAKRCFVFICRNTTEAHLYEIIYNKGVCTHDTLKTYSYASPDYVSAAGIGRILTDVTSESPTEKYSMIIGCHGMGWLPKSSVENIDYKAVMKRSAANVYKTRFFGASQSRYQANISDLVAGIRAAGIRMEYILFDDCYMSNIETAYDLREVTDFLIASTSEIMAVGMPYNIIGQDLLSHDYEGVCDGFLSFYSSYSDPYGTIGVTDCRETEQMAQVMKNINDAYPETDKSTDGVQSLDGYSPSVFFDLESYVTGFCKSTTLLEAFNEELSRLVPYKACTGAYYSAYTNSAYSINDFSGITVSDPTVNMSSAFSCPAVAKEQTNWYKATH